MINKIISILIFIMMVVVVILITPIALVSVGWEAGKEIYQGKKPKIWGMG
jgi:hypothetical protein